MAKPVYIYDEAVTLTIGAMVANDVNIYETKIDSSRGNGFKLIKVAVGGEYSGKQDGEGPLIFGAACNMSAAEIETALEEDPQDSSEATLRSQQAWMKPLFFLTGDGIGGAFGLGGAGGAGVAITGVVPMMEFPVNWSIREGQAFSWWLYNMQAGALTTGSKIILFAEYYGVWLND